MSIKTSRSRVQSVSMTPAVTSGAVLAAAVLSVLARSLSQGAKVAYEQVTKSLPQEANGSFKSLAVLRAEQQAYKQPAHLTNAVAGISPVEAAQVTTLVTLAATPYLVTDQVVLAHPLKELQSAASVNDVQRAERAIRQQLESDHHQALLQSLTVACSNAAIKSGFDSIQLMTGPAGTIRLIASDPAGRALVTEISHDPARDISLETEVVGVSDGSCTALLDAFDAALEAEGVRTSPPQRKYTGGVCELAAARDFLRRKVQRPSGAGQPVNAPVKADGAVRRAQRLHSQQKQKQR